MFHVLSSQEQTEPISPGRLQGITSRSIDFTLRKAILISRLLIVMCLFAACSTTPSEPPSPLSGEYNYTPPSSHLHQGRVIFSDRQFPDAVNPLFSGSTVDFEVSSALWAAPIFYDAQFHVHPDQLTEVPLPENGDVQDAGKTIIMHLRHDLRWSDGQPILASDFQYWWHLDQDPNTGALITSGYDSIASIETPDNYTVVLHMKYPFGPYLLYLPYAAPQHAWGKLRDIDLQNAIDIYLAPKITDGPYMLSSFTNGQSYTMIPNPYYTSTTFHGPFISQLTYQSYDNLASIRTAVQRQQTDITEGYMEYELPQLRQLPSTIKVLQTPAAAYEHLDFNNAEPVFHDLNVRLAISMAINRCAIIKDILGMPDCSRLATQVEPPPSLFYDSHISPIPYDPQTALKLLAKAGWLLNDHKMLTRQGRPFVIRLVTTTDNPLRKAAAESIARDLLAVGISVQLAYYPLNAFFASYTSGGILAKGAFDMAMFAYANGPDPDDEYTAFHSSQIPTSANPNLGNYARIHDPIIDQALTDGRNTVTFADRLADYHTFLERLASQAYIIPLYTGLNILTINARLHNVIPNPNLVANNWNISDWWV